jgi:hypothetical protein
MSMGKISKGTLCSIENCEKEAVRSLSFDKVMSAGLKVTGSKRAYLCKNHYKDFKKANKKAKEIEKWRYNIK